MSLSLPALARQRGVRRRSVTLRPINPTQAQAADLASILAPAWQIWRDAADAIMAGYDPVPLPTGDALVLDSPSQIETAINATAAEFLTRLVTQITPALRRWLVRAEQVHRQRWVSAVSAGLGIDLSTVLTAQPVEETLASFIGRNVALARNISDQAQARISDAVWRGYQNRTPAREVAKEVREATGMGRARAVRIASHQNSVLSAALDTERQIEAGIKFFKWRHSGKLHPRIEHQRRDGKVYEIKSGKRRDGGETIPVDDRPGMKPACGCRSQAFLPIMDEIE